MEWYENPYLQDLFKEKSVAQQSPASRPSHWDLFLDGFDNSQAGRTQVVPVNAGTSPATIQSGFKELARIKVKAEAASYWTVTLGPLSPANFQGPFQIGGNLIAPAFLGTGYQPGNINQAVALVEWRAGDRGAPSFAFVDWAQGTQFSVFASSVRVSGSVTSLATAAVPALDLHTLTAQLTPGQSRNQPRLTVIYDTNISEGAQDSKGVPAFAKDFTFSANFFEDLVVGDVALLGQRVQGGSEIWSLDPINVAGVQPMGNFFSIRIPIGTNYLAIVSTGANAISQARIIWDLALS